MEDDDDLPLLDELDDAPVDDIDDELPPEDDEPLAVDPGEAEPKPIGRRERAVLAAKRAARDERDRADRLQRDLDATRANQNGAATAERERQEREAYALMSPDERREFDTKKLEGAVALQRNQAVWMFNDVNDQRAFDRLCRRDPRIDRLADDVEDRLIAERKAGNNFTREQLAKMLLADRILAKAPKAAAQQRKAGAANLARNRTVAPGARSDGGAGGRSKSLSEREARRERLKNATF